MNARLALTVAALSWPIAADAGPTFQDGGGSGFHAFVAAGLDF